MPKCFSFNALVPVAVVARGVLFASSLSPILINEIPQEHLEDISSKLAQMFTSGILHTRQGTNSNLYDVLCFILTSCPNAF